MPTRQTITKEARVAGRVVPNVIELTSSAGFSQVNAEATIWTTARPSWVEEGQTVLIWAKNTGTGEGTIHGGEVVGVDWSYAPEKIGIVCRDLLARTRLAWGGGEYEYTSQDDAAVIRNLLEKMGIPSSVASIESSSWTLGTIEPIVLADGDVPYSIIEDIDKLAGYKTYSLTTGTIVRRRISGAPGATGAMTFERGVQILSDARRNRTRDGIVNRVIVTGLTYEGLEIGGPGVGEASATNPYIPDPPGYVTETIQSNLVEDDAKALEIAQRMVGDKNRRPEGIDFSIPFDPRVQPGMTVTVNHPSLETGTATVFVVTVSHSISNNGATTTIRTTGGNLSGYSLQPPIPNFAVQTYLEGEDTGSGVTPVVVVICDGSGSTDPDGTIASYAWSVTTDGTASPTSGTGAIFRFTVEGATEIEVTLTVTDSDGETGVLALTVPIDTSAMFVEDLYLAYGDMSCSSDGEQSWRDVTPASGNATCLSPIAPVWQAWGTSTGHIYASFDKLQTTPIDFGAPHGAVACTAVWIHETDATRLWAGFSDGKVYFGTVDTTAHTCSFALAGTITGGPSIVEIRESIGTLGELRATAGTGYYYSFDAGGSWTLQHTFDTAWRMAAGFDTNLASGLNDAAPLYDEDATPPTVPGGVEHIRGLSFGYRQQELYAADDAANLYLGAAPSFDLSLHADNTAAIVNHMIRSGNIDRVVYMAVGDGTGDNGFQKWIPGATPPFFIRKTGTDAGLMIGVGGLHLPDVRVGLILLPYEESGAADKVWFYTPGSGWTGKDPPESGKAWYSIRANPFNGNQLLLLRRERDNDGSGGNALWYSGDNGATWDEVWTDIVNNDNFSARGTYAEWSSSIAGEWISSRAQSGGNRYLIRGNLSAYTEHVIGTDGQQAAVPGLNGDAFYFGYTNREYADVANATNVIGANTFAFGWSRTLRGTRQAAHVVLGLSTSTGVHTTNDYQSAEWSTISGAGGVHSIALLTGGTVICNNGDNIQTIANAWSGSPAITSQNFSTPVGAISSDSKTQTVAAALIGATFAGGSAIAQPVVRDTASGVWSTIPRPPDAGDLANAIEVVAR